LKSTPAVRNENRPVLKVIDMMLIVLMKRLSSNTRLSGVTRRTPNDAEIIPPMIIR
jgi:hypothetical protein